MKKVLTLGFSLVLLCGLSGCGGSAAESILKEQLGLMNDITGYMETIKDDASADAAMPKIEKAIQRMKELEDKLKTIKMPSGEKKRLEDQYIGKELPAAAAKMKTALEGVMKKVPNKGLQIAMILQKAK
jgi:hypothetical protein